MSKGREREQREGKRGEMVSVREEEGKEERRGEKRAKGMREGERREKSEGMRSVQLSEETRQMLHQQNQWKIKVT